MPKRQGTVIDLSARLRHRALARSGSTDRRECIDASLASVTPLICRADADCTKSSQYSDGMLPRCDHFAIVGTATAMSAATSSSDDQRARSSLGEFAMSEPIGQSVLIVKDIPSHDDEAKFGEPLEMPRAPGSSDFKAQFTARVKQARIAAGLTQDEIARLLDMDQGKYKQYEKRSMLPHEYIEKFCIATKIDISDLFEAPVRSKKQRAA